MMKLTAFFIISGSFTIKTNIFLNYDSILVKYIILLYSYIDCFPGTIEATIP